MSSPSPTSTDRRTRPDVPATRDEPRARVSFRQPVSTTGHIDAAWWPGSRDLAAELPPLLDLLWTAGREITRITYNIDAWQPAPRRLWVQGRLVRLGGFQNGTDPTIRLADAWRTDRIDVLVIAADTDPEVARRALLLASETGNLDRAEQILSRARAEAA